MADVDLLFEASSAASTSDLVFGADTTLRTVYFAATIPAPSGGFEFEVEVPAVAVTFAATMAPPTGAFVLELDEMPATYLGPYAGAPWASGTPLKAAPATRWRHGAPLEAASAPRWRDGARVGAGKGIPWQHGARVGTGKGIPWQHGTLVRPKSTGAPWKHGAQVRPESTDIPWQQGLLALVRIDSGWRDGRKVNLGQRMPWRDGRAVVLPQRLLWRDGTLVLDHHRLPWQHGLLVETHGNNPFPPVVPPDPDPCYESSPDLVFSGLAAVDGNLVFRCDYATPDGPTATVVVPIRSAYIVINSISLTLLVGGAQLPVRQLSMAIDADSWTWRWSAVLSGSALGMIDTGGPVEVVATINGTAYRLVIEQISRSRAFARDEVNVSGRGRNSILDVLSVDHGNVAARTAAQLMDDAILPGWTVDFGMDDWLVPAGAWSHQGTPMSAIRTIAAAAGGYIQPHRTNTVVRVLPKYAVAPWDWGTVVPDFELPASVTRREGIEWVSRPDYNRVFVSGVRDGILGQVTRTGSAGDILAQMVTDPLITAVEAARQRGLSILGDTGRQALLSLSLPVLPETGVIEPGKFVRYVDGATTRIGIVRSTTLQGAMPSLSQTIGVETHA